MRLGVAPGWVAPASADGCPGAVAAVVAMVVALVSAAAGSVFGKKKKFHPSRAAILGSKGKEIVIIKTFSTSPP